MEGVNSSSRGGNSGVLSGDGSNCSGTSNNSVSSNSGCCGSIVSGGGTNKRRKMRRDLSTIAAASATAWQLVPRTNTRRSARIAREVYTAWCRRLGPPSSASGTLPADQVQAVFNDIQLYPTESQVCDMLQCAKDCSSDRNSASHLTFGEFCTFAAELKRCYDRGVSYPVSMTKLLDKDGKERKKRSESKISTVMPKYEVFLGGSCNPTTWRQDIAIPLLNKLGITYFNPQVDQWNPELVEIEHEAKENASVLFYVINSETRNVAGIIEAAHLAGMRRKLILVIDDYRRGQTLCGETISQQEYEELNASIQILKDLVERQGIPVFDNIPLAISCTAKVLRGDSAIKNAGISLPDCNLPMKFNICYHNGDTSMKLKEAFNALDKTKNGHINLSDVYLACRILMNRKITVPELRKIVESRADSGASVKSMINFEDFCSVVSNLKTLPTAVPSAATTPTVIGANGINGITAEKHVVFSQPSLNVPTTNIYDVYIGGSCIDCTWVEEIVIPVLRKNNLSYYNGSEVAPDNMKRLDLSSDAAAVNNCYMMLFFVSSTVRGLATMAMAAHYIGLGCNVVLCIQHLTESITLPSLLHSSSNSIGGSAGNDADDDDDSVSSSSQKNEQSLNDYNRGRIYLTDLARRDDIPVLQNIEDAIECVVQKFTQVSSFER